MFTRGAIAAALRQPRMDGWRVGFLVSNRPPERVSPRGHCAAAARTCFARVKRAARARFPNCTAISREIEPTSACQARPPDVYIYIKYTIRVLFIAHPLAKIFCESDLTFDSLARRDSELIEECEIDQWTDLNVD